MAPATPPVPSSAPALVGGRCPAQETGWPCPGRLLAVPPRGARTELAYRCNGPAAHVFEIRLVAGAPRPDREDPAKTGAPAVPSANLGVDAQTAAERRRVLG